MKKTVTKFVTSVFTVPTVLITLNTDALSQGIHDRGNLPNQTIPSVGKVRYSEKVVVSNRKASLVFAVSGKAGRYCAVAVRDSRTSLDFTLIDKTRTTIGSNGIATIQFDMTEYLNKEVVLKLVTSRDASFKEGTEVLGTDWFAVRMTNAPDFKLQQLPLDSDDGPNAVAGVRGRAAKNATIIDGRTNYGTPPINPAPPIPRSPAGPAPLSPRSDGLQLDLNRTGVAEMQRLLGIDEAAAREIIRHRPYRSASEVLSFVRLGEQAMKVIGLVSDITPGCGTSKG
jgi:hypothetical protein